MIRVLLPLLSAVWLSVFAVTAGAQTYPPPATPHVNDFADLLPAEDEAELTRLLKILRADYGVEMTVVTITRRADYGPSDTIEEFATGLFNAWGVGNAERNDGILILVARQDREMRIELGAGYPRAWDWQAQLVIDDYFLPAFRADNYQRGIMTGTDQAIAKIAVAFKEGAEPEGSSDLEVGVAVGIGFLGILALLFRGWIADRIMRFRTCPQCGRKGLKAARRTLRSASTSMSGQGERTITCSNCSYRDKNTYVIPRRTKSSSGSFGGGRSSGGGASGRW